MTAQRDYLNPGSAKLLSGTALAAGILAQIILGKAYGCSATDTAAVATTNTSLGELTLGASGHALADQTTGGVEQMPLLAGPPLASTGLPDGSFYMLQQNNVIPSGGAAASGFFIARYLPPAGASAYPIQTSATLTYGNGQALTAKLGRSVTTNNVVIVWNDTNSGQVKFAVFDQNLATVKAATIIGVTQTGDDLGLIMLANGGFATVWHDSTNKQTKIHKWTAAGLADPTNPGPTTDKTWTVTIGTVMMGGLELSNGKIAIAYKTNYSTDNGTWLSVLNADLTVSLAAVRIAATTTNINKRPIVLQAGSTFAVHSESESKAYVRDLTGAAVATFTSAKTYTNSWSRMVTDGSNYYMAGVGASSIVWCEKFDTTATAVGKPVRPVNTWVAAYPDLVMLPYGMIVMAGSGTGPGQPAWCSFDVRYTQPMPVQSPANWAGQASNTAGMTLVHIGDGVVTGYISDSTDGFSIITTRKCVSSAIQGVTRKAAALGAKVAFLAGKYAADIAQIGGSTIPKTFDHTTGGGVKGALWDVSAAFWQQGF